jgi:hypothetical protein
MKIRLQIGEIDAHYAAFVAENNEGKCPYCGYGDIKGVHNTKREDIFGIEERYKAKLCGKNDGKAWTQRIIDEPANAGLTREQLLAYELRAADQCPFDSANFLKKPFLMACQSAKIFDQNARGNPCYSRRW